MRDEWPVCRLHIARTVWSTNTKMAPPSRLIIFVHTISMKFVLQTLPFVASLWAVWRQVHLHWIRSMEPFALHHQRGMCAIDQYLGKHTSPFTSILMKNYLQLLGIPNEGGLLSKIGNNDLNTFGGILNSHTKRHRFTDSGLMSEFLRFKMLYLRHYCLFVRGVHRSTIHTKG